MAASNRNNRRQWALLRCTLAVLALAAGAPGSAAEIVTTHGTVMADSLSAELRSDTVELSGNVRVTRGPMSIESRTARAVNFQSDDSRWIFQDSVRVRSDEAELRADSASAAIVEDRIARARVEGSPAQFEQRGERAEVRGRAAVIEYDFAAGIVKLTEDVWFSNGKDEFRGDVVIYNVRDERVQVNPGGQSPGRVRATIRPRARDGNPAAAESGA